jgi:hypothetical protein
LMMGYFSGLYILRCVQVFMFASCWRVGVLTC